MLLNIKSYKVKSIIAFVTMTFAIPVLKLSSFYSNVSQQNGHQGLLTWQEMLDRRLLFHSAIPSVRSPNIPTFDNRDLIVAIERLRTRKMSRIRFATPEYFDFREINASKVDMSKTVHIAFVGDSRIRQLFSMFMTAIPDYDRLVHPLNVQHGIAGLAVLANEVVAYSALQDMIGSFYWRGLLADKHGNELMSKFFRNWLDYDENSNYTHVVTPHPDVLVLGISPHHMVRENMVFEKPFFRALKNLVPLLQEISKNCRVVWLNQYPTQELYGKNNSHNTDVHASKIWHYNVEAEKILRAGGIVVWNSASPIVEEYIRSCGLFQRQDGNLKNYFDCKDYIHPGTSALTDIIQIFHNVVFLSDGVS